MPDIVQRWRVVYRRGEAVAGLAQRGELEAWEAAVVESGIPVASTGGAHPRPRLSMAPPLPAGLTGDRELLDLLLVERRTSTEVRERLVAVVPPDHALVELFDVWVGASPLPAQVVAVDYALRLQPAVGHEALRAAIARVLAAPRLERVRRKGERETRYDLRPFILGLETEPGGAVSGAVRMRLAVHPEQGTGRPDEVVAAVSAELGEPLEIAAGVRTRVWTADEVIPPAP